MLAHDDINGRKKEYYVQFYLAVKANDPFYNKTEILHWLY